MSSTISSCYSGEVAYAPAPVWIDGYYYYEGGVRVWYPGRYIYHGGWNYGHRGYRGWRRR